jgi:predicted metal-dependent enzyme (double-stranded beta helix superfamily)
MLSSLTECLYRHPGAHQRTVGHDVLRPLLRDLLAAAGRVALTDVDVPYGRYLIHAHPDGLFNLQLDVFSRDYVGGVHAHETWGLFIVLRGGLTVEDWQEVDGRVQLGRTAWIGRGGGQAFSPPVSDWHRVRTDPTGPQTVSVHIYGAGFDMDSGLVLDEAGQPRAYRRGAFGDPAALAALFPARVGA